MILTRRQVVVHIGPPPAASVIARELCHSAVVLTRAGAHAGDAIRAETRPRKEAVR